MAIAANAPRLAATRLLDHQVAALAIAIGMVIKEYRDYEGGPAKPSKTQTKVSKEANTSQAAVSKLERGESIPGDSTLKGVLRSIGLNPSSKDGAAVFALLRAVRDNRRRIARLERHKPK